MNRSTLVAWSAAVILSVTVGCGDGAEPVISGTDNNGGTISDGEGGSGEGGQTTVGTGGAGGEDAGQGGADPTREPSWNAVTGANANMAQEFQVYDGTIYAVIGDKICSWDAVKGWIPYTASHVDLKPEFEFANKRLYAVIGDKICYWHVTQQKWLPHTTAKLELKTAIQMRGNNGSLYAVIGDKICYWNDGAQTWTAATPAVPLGTTLRPAFRYLNSTDYFYALIDNKICWVARDDLDGKWKPLTTDLAGIEKGIDIAHQDEIYAPIGNEMRMWDGSKWALYGTVAGLQKTVDYKGPDNVYALVNNEVWRWY